MKYQEAIAKLYRLESRGVRLGLERTRQGLLLRGSPERDMILIHVAGTNGKGSVASILAESLRRAGYRTGLFTSPHLHRFVERIRINGRPISQKEAARRITELLHMADRADTPEFSFFEVTTLLAIESFRDHRVDVAVLEVGLGGRLDSTNAMQSVLSVIVNISLDHTNVLGDTTADVAREKSGIIKQGIPLIVGSCDSDARRIIRARAKKLQAPTQWLGRDFDPLPSRKRNHFDVRVPGAIISNLKVPLLGAYQQQNVACAVAALHKLREMGLFELSDDIIRQGVAKVRWPGRLELKKGTPSFLFDAAHNPDGCRTLAEFLKEKKSDYNRIVLIFGAMVDKDYPAMIQTLARAVDRIFYALPRMPRAATFESCNKIQPGIHTRSIPDALERARRTAGDRGLVVVAGTIFLVADVRAKVLGLRADPLIRM